MQNPAARPDAGPSFALWWGSLLLSLAFLASAASAATQSRRELVPTGARATIYLEAPGSADDTLRELYMEKGKSVFIRTAYPVRRVSVGDPSVADVVPLQSTELQFVPKTVGSTNVVIWSTSGQIEAAIDVHVGRAFSWIEREIRRVVDVGDVRVDSAGESIVLTGSVPDAATVERVLAVASAYFKKKDEKEEGEVINLLTVGGNQQVMIEVTVSEMSRSLTRTIGTNFAASIVQNGERTFDVFNSIDGLARPDQVEVGGALQEIVEFSDQVNFIGSAFPIGTGVYQFYVNALAETGLGKVLAEPTLVARTGETARFLAGGEVPIPIAQAGNNNSITIEFKEFGIGVAFTPTVIHDERIHLVVETEVSEPDFTLSTTLAGFTTPGFRTRRASTGVDIGDGQTLAIAGLLSEDLSARSSGYPLLKSIPILGSLVRSSTWEKTTTELVLLVRPRLVKPIGDELPPLPTDYLDEANPFEFYLLGRVEGFDDLRPEESEGPPEAGLIGEAGYRLPATPENGGN
ncbi:MAG: type II and III secretion system protein family protein [Myxococcota bacterium]